MIWSCICTPSDSSLHPVAACKRLMRLLATSLLYICYEADFCSLFEECLCYYVFIINFLHNFFASAVLYLKKRCKELNPREILEKCL